ncbi:MAG TPA: hypothetical protein VFQ60_01165, partial [Patescibacteria group bacterium]|nr:hypothetical protein [Patescibacteria group bacterium]
AGVSRVTTYAVIESLMKTGLMSTVQKGKKSLYVSESPERLVAHMQAKMDGMKATLKEIQSSLDELKLLQHGEKPVVKMFEGAEAVRMIGEDIAKIKPDMVYEFACVEATDSKLPEEIRNANREALISKNIKVTAVYASKNQDYTSSKNVALYLLPQDFHFEGDIAVYANKIALMCYSGAMLTVLIESAEMAQTLKEMFRAITSNGSVAKRK